MQQQFVYHEAILGFVSKVYPYVQSEGNLYVDVVPLDLRGLVYKSPIFLTPGMARNFRQFQMVTILYVQSNSQLPIIIGHTFNGDQQYPDLMPTDVTGAQVFANLGDHVVTYHPETSMFERVSAINASPTTAAVDGGPAKWTRTFASGLSMTVVEYNPPGYPMATPPGTTPTKPPKPPRAKFSVITPSLFKMLYDEPTVGKATFQIDHPAGTTINVDINGNVLCCVASNATLEIDTDGSNASIVLGKGAVAPAQELAYKSDVEALRDTFNAHEHNGVMTGGGVSGTPTSPAAAPVGTKVTVAK